MQRNTTGKLLKSSISYSRIIHKHKQIRYTQHTISQNKSAVYQLYIK